MKYIYSVSLLLLFSLIANSHVFAFSNGPPDGRTGGPNELTCATAGCHLGKSLNSAGGSLVLTVPETYMPGMVYDIIVELRRSGQSKWGFEMTALNSKNDRAGTFSKIDGNTQTSGEDTDRQYIKHTFAGNANGKQNSNSWRFKWTAPDSNVGPITFYTAGNASNGNFNPADDYIYTQEATSEVVTHGVTITSDEIRKETTDANTGVEYTLKVTNTGNVEDTIQLGSSAEFGIGGAFLGSFKRENSQDTPTSQLEITLDPGETTDVIFIASGDLLTKPGVYPIIVTASSKGNPTKTAKINTITKIEAVYGVSITGIGDLTQEIDDASSGVNYTLRITNTGNDRDRIRLSTTGDITAALSSNIVILESGASRNITLSIPSNSLSRAGEYSIKVTATSQGDLAKTAEISTTTSILPVYGVSLVGIGDLTSETSDASDGVSYKFSLSNTGNTDDILALSISGDVSGTLSQTTVSLSYGTSKDITLTIPGSVLAKAGDYTVKVTATSQGNLTKTAEITTTTTILPVYGVSLVGIGDLTSETSDASDGVSYKFSLSNTGNTDDILALSISGDVSDTLSQTTVSLSYGTSKDITLTIPGSVLAKAGDYTVKVTATSQGNLAKTAEISTTTSILPVYGVSLVGIGDLTSETTDASDGVSYKFTISNTGNTDDILALSISGDVSGTLSQTTVSLSYGTSKDITLTIPGSVLAKAGDYTVKVTATSQGDLAKTAEISTMTSILPVYGVSLVGIGDLTSETSDASDGVSYKFTVTNTGNTDDTIRLSSSGDVASTLSQTSVSLASGISSEITLTINGASLVSAGDYVVKVAATSQGDIEKIAELTTTTKILPVYGVRLVGIGDLTFETTDASDGVSYKFTVTNTGNTDDTIRLSSSGDVASTLSQTSVSLASGISSEITLTINGASLVSAGDYVVKVSATSQGDIEKIAELTTTTTILPIYGVILGGVGNLITETTDAGDGVSYTFTVTNIGNTDDIINLSSSNDTISTLSQTSVSLASGASSEITLTINGASLVSAGDYVVKVSATSQGDIEKIAELTTTTTILPIYGVTLGGVGDLTTKTNNASNGVSYTLTITNTGNTEDTFVLTSSDNTATINQSLVSIGSNASTIVILTIPASTLATAGDYIVRVTATSQGDNTKSAEISTMTSILPIYDVTISGLMKLSTDTSDTDAGISYKLTVTNNGNTDDVINLSTSDDALTTLNPNSISLASGTSQEVVLTVSADALSTAGEFEVRVTATSQGDPTITDETTISTSIDPVYGVMFEGADQLVDSTMDILDGVSYELILTNIGNIEDTILLSSSAEVGIEGSVLGSFKTAIDQEISTSQVEITLKPGSSVTLTFIVAGDSFTKPGDYEIIVTASSQGDTTKSVDITTTTTINPVVWDLNADGIINILDLVSVSNQFGKSGEGLIGDVNEDGTVNILDLVQVASYFGKSQVEIIEEMQ